MPPSSEACDGMAATEMKRAVQILTNPVSLARRQNSDCHLNQPFLCAVPFVQCLSCAPLSYSAPLPVCRPLPLSGTLSVTVQILTNPVSSARRQNNNCHLNQPFLCAVPFVQCFSCAPPSYSAPLPVRCSLAPHPCPCAAPSLRNLVRAPFPRSETLPVRRALDPNPCLSAMERLQS